MSYTFSQVCSPDLLSSLRRVVHNMDYEAARIMADVIRANATIIGVELPGYFKNIETSIDRLSIGYHMLHAFQEFTRKCGPIKLLYTRTGNTLTELEKVRSVSEKLELPLPKEHNVLMRMVDSEMAGEFLTDASMRLKKWKETGVCDSDPSFIGRCIDASEICYRSAGETVPKKIRTIRRKLTAMRKNGVIVSSCPGSV